MFVLGAQNAQLVTLNFVIASAEIPMSFVLSISFALGALLGFLLSLRFISSLKFRNYRLQKNNQKLTQSRSESA